MLEVIALSPQDALAAYEGGADRIELVGTMDQDGLSPLPRLVSGIREKCEIPIRAMVRAHGGFAARDINALIETAQSLEAAGVQGLVLGWVAHDSVGEAVLDARAIAAVCDSVTLPITLHRAIEHTSDFDSQLTHARATIPRLDTILTAGSPEGVSAGLRALARVAADHSDLILVGGGLKKDHLPQLRALGYTRFHVGSAVRDDGSFSHTVCPDLVHEWKTLTESEFNAEF